MPKVNGKELQLQRITRASRKRAERLFARSMHIATKKKIKLNKLHFGCGLAMQPVEKIVVLEVIPLTKQSCAALVYGCSYCLSTRYASHIEVSLDKKISIRTSISECGLPINRSVCGGHVPKSAREYYIYLPFIPTKVPCVVSFDAKLLETYLSATEFESWISSTRGTARNTTVGDHRPRIPETMRNVLVHVRDRPDTDPDAEPDATRAPEVVPPAVNTFTFTGTQLFRLDQPTIRLR